MASGPIRIADCIRLGEDVELDFRAYELRRGSRVLKLERIPMELLRLLVENRGQLVGRDQIVAKIWGQGVFLDADNSINAAIRKIRHVLKDDPDHPRFIQTVTGKGYRFIASAVEMSLPGNLLQTATRPEAGRDNLIGRKVSHYRILELLGGGGMGVVYKAEDLKLGRRVAIKFLPNEIASNADAFARLRREARAASALEHPNICPIYQLDEEGGQPFIVMQLLEGQTLREWVEKATNRSTPSCLNEVRNLGIQICRGLQAAHERGIVHRDIKPANIFITVRGEAKILDFGVATFTDGTDAPAPDTLPEQGAATVASGQISHESGPSTTGRSLGTPFYLSPEQVEGEKLDARADLFSFGLVLYEMATGTRAFSGDTATEIEDAVLHLPVTGPRQLQPGIPPELERIIQKALEKDRTLRYQTAGEIQQDLQRLTLAPASSLNDAGLAITVVPGAAMTSRKSRAWLTVGSTAFLVAAIAGVLYYRAYVAGHLNAQDTIVIADFSNSTGDAVFDEALTQGLYVALRQSPFLSVLSDDKVAANLKLMTRPPGTAVVGEVAREVCQRSGSKAYIEGAIAALGTEYVLGLKAVNCRNGETLSRAQTVAVTKEKVIFALGEAASKLRGELGESLATVQKYDVPLEQATTASLEALKTFSLGRVEANRGKYPAAIFLYKRAVEIDPKFAMAHARLGQVYANSNHSDLAVDNVRQAFALKDRTSELEKLYIITRYYEIVTGETDKRIEAFQLWRDMYPRDPAPANDLASEYSDMGRYSEALAEARLALELAPTWHTAHELLGVSYLGLNRLAEAKATRQREIELKIDYHWDHIDLYSIAFLENDQTAMQSEIQWAKGKPYEFFMLKTVGETNAALGKIAAARESYRQAIENVRQQKFADLPLQFGVDLDMTEALIGGSPNLTARENLMASANRHTLYVAGCLYAMMGDARRAGMIADRMTRLWPTDSYVNNVKVPTIKAEMEIRSGNPAKAVELLKSAAPYDLGWKAQNLPDYIRGLAYLRAGKGEESAAEFQKIVDHPGVCASGTLSPLICSLSYLQFARARSSLGDIAGARTAYQSFLQRWRDADDNTPILKQARSELQRLN